MYKFKHRILNFNVVGVLMSLGITPKTYPLRYYALLPEVHKIIELQVRVSAEKLNHQIKVRYAKDMYDIDEYLRFPGYISVMQEALSNPVHVGSYWDSRNVIQAKFIDTDALGDIGDLQAIQYLAYPGRGSLGRWKGIYIAWREGRDNTYANTVGRRLELMRSFGVAPFWRLIEEGNQQYPAYPVNSPKRTLSDFKNTYNNEMMSAYSRVISAIRVLLGAPDVQFREFQTTMVLDDMNKPHFGYKWTSRTGKGIFAIAGTERLIGGKLVAKGFMIGPAGLILKRWGGWLPR